MKLLYDVAVRGYGLLIRAAAFRKTKAAQWVNGRHNWRQTLMRQRATFGGDKVVWVHCASYGEFEQGRPLIESFKNANQDYRIVLSFFSPSGYEAFKDWQGADMICYLPLDTRKNAEDFLSVIKPALAIFIKYEFWVNYLFALKNQRIPAFLVSAVFKRHHPFFKWYGGLFRRSLQTFTQLYIQDEASGELLRNIGVTHYEVCGDTRFDRVTEIRKNFTGIPAIAGFKGDGQLIVAGSTWPKDDELLISAFRNISNAKRKLLLVPHDIEEDLVAAVVEKLRKAGLSCSRFTKGIDNHAAVLVLDTMGMLSRSYYYADVAYIGGGFNGGIHNSLEPAVFGVPVVFYGNSHDKFNEAVELTGMGAGFNVNREDELAELLNILLEDDQRRVLIKNKLERYFKERSNSTARILSSIQKHLRL